MNEMIKKMVLFFKPTPVLVEKTKVPHGAKWRYKGRTAGAFGRSWYLKTRVRRMKRAPVFRPTVSEGIKLQNQRRRRKIRRFIKAA